MNLAPLKCSASMIAVAVAWGVPIPSPAAAADMPVKARPAPVVAPAAVSWTGFYVGGHVGWGRARHSGSYEDPDSVVFAEALKLRGILGGIHAGYNWDAGNWVWGIEGDWSFMRWKRTALGISSDHMEGKINGLGSIRARLGIPLGAARSGLAYLTGGAGFIRSEVTVFGSVQPTANFETLKFNRVGGVVGGGFEWAATNQLRLRAETLYYIFDHSKPIAVITEAPTDHVKLRDVWTARVGLSWYFSPPGAVVARY
jgi:outer membrane immunogenic protein